MAERKIDGIAASLKKTVEDTAATELQQKINQFATIQDMLKNADTTTLANIFSTSSLGEYILGLDKAGESMEAMIQNLDKIKSASKDINIVGKITGSGFLESAENVKKLYAATQKTLEAKNNLNEAEKLQLDGIESQIKAVNKLSEAYRKQTNDRIADIAREKKEYLSLSTLISEKFGKSSGSTVLGALMGHRESGNISQYLLNVLGQKSGIAGSLQDSPFAKMIAKGFDMSDSNKKILENSIKSTEIQSKDSVQLQQVGKSALTGLLVTGAATTLAARSIGGASIRGVGHVVDAVQGLRDPFGMDRAIWGKGGGWAVGKVFGKETGNAFSGIVGQLLDALTYTAQRRWESASYKRDIEQQGGRYVDLFSAEQEGVMTKEELQNIGRKYTRKGLRMGGLRNYIRLQGYEQTLGEDVMSSGYDIASKGMLSGNMEGAERVGQRLAHTFMDIKENALGIGASVHEVTKNLIQASEQARFFNVDLRGATALYKTLFEGHSKELMAAGVDVKNPGQALSNIMGIGKNNIGMDLWLQGAMGKDYGSTEKAMMGNFFNATPMGLNKYKFSKQGWSLGGVSTQADMDKMKADSGDYMRNKLINARNQALVHGMTPVATQMMQKLFGVSNEEAKILLHEKALSAGMRNQVMDIMNRGAESPEVSIKQTASSSAKMAGLQANTVKILVSMLALIIALPKAIAAAFNFGDVKAVNEVWKSNSTSIINALDRMKGITAGSDQEIRDALNLWGELKGTKKARIDAGLSTTDDWSGTKDAANPSLTIPINKNRKARKALNSKEALDRLTKYQLENNMSSNYDYNSSFDLSGRSFSNQHFETLTSSSKGKTINLNINGSLLVTGKQIKEILNSLQEFEY